MNNENAMRSKNLDLELMRILACFFVIFNHTGNNGFFLFSSYDNHSLQFWVYLFISVFCKFSVPLFFAITGALMLNRERESLKKLWSHRVAKMIMILFVWSLLYYLLGIYKGEHSFTLTQFLKQWYSSDWNFSFWYLYAYIPLIMTLPILQCIAKSVDDKTYVYMFGLIMVFGSIIPIVQFWAFKGELHLNGNFNINWMSTQIFLYPLLGYFLQHRIRKTFWTGRCICGLWIINLATIIVSCYMTYYRAVIMGELNEGVSQSFHNTFVIINTISVFALCKYLALKISHRCEGAVNMIKSIGGGHSAFTFYIYGYCTE